MQQTLRLAVAAVLLGAALGIQAPHQKYAADALAREFDAALAPGPVPATGCKAYIDQANCSADDCCTWCGPKLPPTVPVPVAVGFCMQLLPVKTSLVCDKEPSTCKVNTVNTTCLAQPSCSWIPFNNITGSGMCMYDWDSCKTPPATPAPSAPAALSKADKQAARKRAAADRIAHKAAKSGNKRPIEASPAPAPPVPKLNCTLATAEECDASKCCQWCGSVWNTTSPGWCMPVLDEPIPMMTCSKGSMSCSSLAPAACNTSDTCSWMPFGPATSTMGVCVFDWKKCMAPPS